MDRFRPESFLPLTPVAFEILLALADGEQHGYSIMREVERRSAGAVTLHPGTLYRALARLLESGLIEELERAARSGARRRAAALLPDDRRAASRSRGPRPSGSRASSRRRAPALLGVRA